MPFGIAAAIATAATPYLGGAAAGLLADSVVGGGVGALLGGGISGLEGGNIGQGILHGAEGGALTGAGAGLGGDLFGGIAGSALGGAAGGALGSEVTGGKPLTGALEGGIGGGLSSLIQGNTSLFGNTGVDKAVTGLFGSSGLTPGGTPTPEASLSPGQISNIGATAALNPGTGGAPVGAAGGGAAATAAPAGAVGGGGLDLSQLNQTFDPTQSGTGAFQPGGQNGLNNILTQASGSTPTGGATAGGATAGGTTAGSGTGYTGLNLSALGGGAGGANGTGNAVSFGDSALGSNTITRANIGDGAPSGGTGGGAGGTGTANPFPGNTGVNLAESITGLGANASQPTGAAFGNFLQANGSLLPAAGVMGYEAIAGQKMPKGYNQLQTEAGQLSAQGTQLENYINTGTLPPGLQGAVQQNLAATQAAIKSSYAAKGMSGSSAEQQDLQNAEIQSQAQTAQLATGLLSEGVAETGDAAGIYNNLIGDIQKSDQNLQSALAEFAAASAGQGIGGTGTKITVGPNGIQVG